MKRNQIRRTEFALKAINILFLSHPIRTSVGIIIGLTMFFLINIFKPYLVQFSFFDTEAISAWGFICLGVLITNIPYLFNFIRKKPIVNEQVDNVIQLIEASNFSEIEKRNSYRKVLEKVLENISLDNPSRTDYEMIQKQLKNE